MQYLAVLGRQPKLSLAELESLFSDVTPLSPKLATFTAKDAPDLAKLGGSLKLARELSEKPEQFLKSLKHEGKITLGVSDYSKHATIRSATTEALRLKRILKSAGRSVRVLSNKSAELSTATVFHNQLGEKPGHIELIKFNNRWFIGLAVQNINAYAARDQKRPARDAKVGMLPPKLAQLLINLCGPLPKDATILDPFCGTGVVLQEALLMGYHACGTDKELRMIDYSERNLKHYGFKNYRLEPGDATNHTWQQPIDAVACEVYLGPPMSQPPVEIKLKSAEQECKGIITGFLKNLAPQISKNTSVILAIPAWLREDGHYHRLKLLDDLPDLGYNVKKYNNLSQKDLLYYRDGQVVAREIIVLRKK